VRENNVFASQNYFFLAPIFRLQAFSDDFWISYFVFSGLKNVIVNIFLQKIWLLGNRQTATKSVFPDLSFEISILAAIFRP